MHDPSADTAFLFTDIEGSTRLWEHEPERMRPALASHDVLIRIVVESHRGTVVKMIGDGVHAVFDDALDAVGATLQLQQALADPAATNGVALKVRCGVHVGVVERRDNDYFGTAVNRAARIMGAAHGGQIILSQAVADRIAGRLPQSVSLRDLGAVRLRDLARPERVYQVLHPELRQDFPALRSLESTPNNLPQQTTSFVGRESELAELRNLLPNTRLLTLVGSGGLGKTRLTLQLGAEMLDDFPDGVWFVELAPIADALVVPQTVASVLGVREEPGQSVEEALHAFAKDRRLLLVQDNCEHLAQASAELIAGILRTSPGVKVVASSRVPLHVGGETTYSVMPLATPDPEKDLGLDALARCEAVRLFQDRALAVQPAFRLTEQNASAVAQICHHLDGIPLALELAAARVRALSANEVAARLTDRFRILTGGYRTALPRQQTLRACIDWSYDLLTRPEQVVFQRLAVFAGGWTLAAAEAVCANGEIDASDVLNLVTQLVEKSLVTTDADFTRYQFLETIREYSLERLSATVEEDSVRRRHLTYFATLAEEATPELVGPKPGEALARLDAEQKNIFAAHAWTGRDNLDAELALRLAVATFHVWTHRGSLAVGYRLLVETFNRPHAQERTLARSRAIAAAGNFAILMERYRDAQIHAEESLAIAREIGDKGRIAMTLQLMGIAVSEQGDRAAALQYFEESIAMIREIGPPRRMAAALQNLAHWHQDGGNFAAAEAVLEQTLALTREIQDRGANTAAAMTNLAGLAVKRGAYARVRELLCEAAEISEEIGSRYAGGLTLNGAMELAAYLEDWIRAARLIGATKALSAQTGNRRDELHDDRVREALGADAFMQAEAEGMAVPYEAMLSEVRAWLESRA